MKNNLQGPIRTANRLLQHSQATWNSANSRPKIRLVGGAGTYTDTSSTY